MPTKTEILEALFAKAKAACDRIYIEEAADIIDKLINPVDPRAVTKDTPEDALVDWVGGNGRLITSQKEVLPGNILKDETTRLHACFANFPVTDGVCTWDELDFPLNVKVENGMFYYAVDRAHFGRLHRSYTIIACYPVWMENE